MHHLCGVAGLIPEAELRSRLLTMCRAIKPAVQAPDHALAAPQAQMAVLPLRPSRSRPEPSPLLGDAGDGSLFCADAVLDNRDELQSELVRQGLTLPDSSDAQILHGIWRSRGLRGLERLVGDWVCARWEPEAQRLTLVRDHHGNSALYYFRSPRFLAFSTSFKALQALPEVASDLNDLCVACAIAHLPPPGTRTMMHDIHLLPPAHWARLEFDTHRTRRYWFPEAVQPWSGQTEETYAEALRSSLVEAVAPMLARAQRPGLTLSAGLDSGAIAWASVESADSGPRPVGFCATPLHDTQAAWPAGFLANEEGPARATAERLGLPEFRTVDAAHRDPLQGIDYMLNVSLEPSIGAGNMYWMSAMMTEAAARGCDLLLTGQQGNGTISWYGRPWSRTFMELARGRGLMVALRHKLARPVLRAGGTHLYNRAVRGLEPWLRQSPLQPAMARRLHLREYVADAAYDRWYQTFDADPVRYRMQVIEPGGTRVGARWADRGYYHGLRVRDPTANWKLVELCLSIPDAVWSGPRGTDRWLIRRALAGRLPDTITGTLTRGRQSADLFQRLVALEPAVTRILERLRSEPAVTRFLVMERAWRSWRELRASSFTYRHQQRCLTEIVPSLAYGLFLLRMRDRDAYRQVMEGHLLAE